MQGFGGDLFHKKLLKWLEYSLKVIEETRKNFLEDIKEIIEIELIVKEI
jgi:hypothetical protein